MKPLKDRSGWKVILGLIIVLLITAGITVLVSKRVTKKANQLNTERLEEAQDAGYFDVMQNCTKKDNLKIGEVEYEQYACTEYVTFGKSYEDIYLIKVGSAYKDGTDGKKEKLVIYGEKVERVDGGIVVEPYSVYYSKSMSFYGFKFLFTIVALLALFIVMFVVYFAIFLIRKNDMRKMSSYSQREEETEYES